MEDNKKLNKESLKELIQGLKEGKISSFGLSLELREVDLSDQDLTNIDLSGADLSGADLTGANLEGAKLFRTKLRGASLERAILNNAELTGADLSNADMEDVVAIHAGFGKANLQGANLFNAKLDGSTLTMANLHKADMRAASLKGVRMREADLIEVDFTSADLRDADLSLSNVEGANFTNADLRRARVRLVKGFEKANWIGVDIRDINFSGAYLMRRFILDQNFLEEFRRRSRLSALLYYLWWITSDCGRSMLRWCLCTLILVIFFGWLYSLVGVDYGEHKTWLSPFYYSVVTLTTLGYGDVVPASTEAQIIAMIEVITGYIMLGGLLSIFTNKMARRAD